MVSESLKLLFNKDNDFKNSLEDSNNDSDDSRNDGGSLFEIVRKA